MQNPWSSGLTDTEGTVLQAPLTAMGRSARAETAPRTAGLTQQTFIFTLLQLQVWDQGVSRVGFLQGLSPGLVNDGLLSPASSRGPSCVCVLTSSPSEDTSHITLKPIQVNLFYLNYLFKRPCLQIQIHSEVLKVRTSTYTFWGDIFGPWHFTIWLPQSMSFSYSEHIHASF